MSGCRNFKRLPVYTKSRTPPKKEQTAVAVFAAWLFFAPLAATTLNHFPGRVMPALLPPTKEFLIAIALLAFIAGVTHAFLFVFSPNKISHAIYPAFGLGLFAAASAFLVFLTRSKDLLLWPPSGTQFYIGLLLLSVGILFSYFVVVFIIRKQGAPL